jgi:hypothetical protein
MPLTFTGLSVETETGFSLQAQDDQGKIVPVKVSHEAMQDFDLSDVQEAASTKFDQGKTEKDGSVSVKTADLS